MIRKIVNRIRFWISLWGGLFFLYLFRFTGNERDDRPGSAALKLYKNFLKDVAKPKLTIVVTGTNGKTTISSVITDILRMQGLTVAYNDWGANARPGQARCLLDAVNIFNRPIKDAAVIETDELTSPASVPLMNPDIIIVNNLARDSMLRNGHPEHVYNQLAEAINRTPNAFVIVNGDDPICNGLGKNNKVIHFGMCDQQIPATQTILDDFAVCPVCGATPHYHFRNARHIGDYRCPKCGFSAPRRDYFATHIDYLSRSMTLREPNGSTNSYPLISDALHNAYNLIPVIACLREYGISADDLSHYLSQVKLPASRERRLNVNGIDLITHIAKGQNPTAVSTVMEYISQDDAVMEVVMFLDEVFENPLDTEAISWIWETDYEILKKDNIKRIIVAGERHLDHRLRLLVAGIPEEKIVYAPREEDAIQLVDIHGVEKIYLLHDVHAISRSVRICEAIQNRIKTEGGGVHDN